ncbi:MAG: hypothetical protein AAAC47_12340, partial [Pararhizobium sp.]
PFCEFAMASFRLLFISVLAAATLIGFFARADTATYEAVLYCDMTGNKALLLFTGGWDPLPDLPPDMADGLSGLAPATDNMCTLSDGRAIKAKVGSDQAFPYGMCGADPPHFFSLWIDRKKILSGENFYGGCTYGFTRRAIVLDAQRLTDCRIVSPGTPEGQPPMTAQRAVNCRDVSWKLADAKLDEVEYPPNGIPRPVGAIMIEKAVDTAFCERFIRRAEDDEQHQDGVIDHWGAGDRFRIDFVASKLADAKFEKAKRGNIYIGYFDNDRQPDRILWSHGWSAIFDGDYFVIVSSNSTLAPLFETTIDSIGGIDKMLAAAEAAGLTVVSGAKTPYEDVRYTHFEPIVVDGAMLLFAWPTSEVKRPTAILYKPGPKGALARLCDFQRVEENF